VERLRDSRWEGIEEGGRERSCSRVMDGGGFVAMIGEKEERNER